MPPPPPPPPPQPQYFGTYVVRKEGGRGESIRAIAEKMGVDCAELVRLNRDRYRGINTRSHLMTDTVLHLPPRRAAPAAPPKREQMVRSSSKKLSLIHI